MSLEKIGVLFLLNYFNQLGSVKQHLLLAFREVLLAMKTSVDIVTQSTSKTILGNRIELLAPVFSQVQKVLSYSIDKVSPPQPAEINSHWEDSLKLKDHIVSSIISAIDDEIENTKSTLSEKNKLKIEALHTVKQVLITQKKKPFVSPLKLDEKGITKSVRVA